MKIICIGLIVSDIIVWPVKKDILDRDSSFIDTLTFETGGDAFNVAVNMAVLGEKVELVGRVGADTFGYDLIDRARKLNIGTDNIILDPEKKTSMSIVLVEPDGERHFLYYGDTNNGLTPADVKTDLFQKGDIVHLGSALALPGLDGQGTAKLFREAKAKGCITSMDVTNDKSGKWLENVQEALAYTDIFLPSDYEARQIAGTDNLGEMKDFFRRYGIRILVIKMGKKGCYVTDFKTEIMLAPLSDQVIDTTGAGDAFVSGFLKGIARGYTMMQCAVLGNYIAAACITEIGAVSGVIKKYKNPEAIAKLLQAIDEV